MIATGHPHEAPWYPDATPMGLDASVMCNCLRDGKCRPPPFPIERVVLDGEGWPDLTAPDGAGVTLEEHMAFRDWRLDACEHEDMEQASEWISNWYGVRRFQQTLRALGAERFPVLTAAIPDANGGCVAPEKAPLAMQELELLEGLLPLVVAAVLVDQDTREVVWHHIEAWEGELILDGRARMRAGLDPQGFFVLDDVVAATGERADRTLFRSSHFVQKHAPFCCVRDPDKQNVLLTDIATGASLQFPSPIGSLESPEQRFRVDQRALSSDDHAHVIAALRTLFRASIETGNPVRWS